MSETVLTVLAWLIVAPFTVMVVALLILSIIVIIADWRTMLRLLPTVLAQIVAFLAVVWAIRYLSGG